MVEFVDGSMLAQCGVPDMRVPILFCLGYPERLPFAFQPFDPVKWRNLAFEPFPPERYPAVGLAYEALRLGGDAGARLNAADEVATAAFLGGRIAFPHVAATAAHVLALRAARPIARLADVTAADAEARMAAQHFIDTLPAPAP
jgi:1-deoxy-D-xylulose-5-phosphate reductoisomerase